MTHASSTQELINKLNKETATIPWLELQRFFAAGNAVRVEKSLDLIQVAVAFSEDNKSYIGELMASAELALVEDTYATKWSKDNTLVWAVVISPWVIVQEVV